MEVGKRHDTTDFCPRQIVTDLLRGNWCNGIWPLCSSEIEPLAAAAAAYAALFAGVTDCPATFSQYVTDFDA